MRYAAALPPRVAEGGVYYFRLALVAIGDKSQLVLERMIPDAAALQAPEFRDAERSVLADGIAELQDRLFRPRSRRGRCRRADVARPLGRQAAAAAARAHRREAGERRRVADARRRAAARAGGRAARRGTRRASAARAWADARRVVLASARDRHRAHRRAVAHGAAHGDRERLRVSACAARRSPRATRCRSRRRARRPTARSSARRSSSSRPRSRRRLDARRPSRTLEGRRRRGHRRRAVDESARIDINAAPTPLLKGLLQNVGGLDADAAQHVVDAILDWRDADDLKRPNGAEAPDYRRPGANTCRRMRRSRPSANCSACWA